MAILSTRQLTAGYRKGSITTPILTDLNLNLKQGALVALVGANGIGKSTLLRTIVGNHPPLSGEISISGNNINEISRQELALSLSIVTTDRTQAGGLTVKELVSLGRQPYTGFLGILGKQDRKIIEESLTAAGIAHKAHNFVAELSDGERQKAMIAKALAQQTPLIILDEPTAFLDVESRMETMLLLHNLAHKQNKAILFSSHDLSQSLLLADELWIVTHDRQLICGNTEDLALSGALNRIFASNHIRFDQKQGDFCINVPCQYKVNLICKDKILKRWIRNALRRNDIATDSTRQSKITIDASSPQSGIILYLQQKTITVKTITELISFIRRISPELF